MLNVCNKHVHIGLHRLVVPHVKKIKGHKYRCFYCNEEAEIKLYSPAPFSIEKYSKLKEHHLSGFDVSRSLQKSPQVNNLEEKGIGK